MACPYDNRMAAKRLSLRIMTPNYKQVWILSKMLFAREKKLLSVVTRQFLGVPC